MKPTDIVIVTILFLAIFEPLSNTAITNDEIIYGYELEEFKTNKIISQEKRTDIMHRLIKKVYSKINLLNFIALSRN